MTKEIPLVVFSIEQGVLGRRRLKQEEGIVASLFGLQDKRALVSQAKLFLGFAPHTLFQPATPSLQTLEVSSSRTEGHILHPFVSRFSLFT